MIQPRGLFNKEDLCSLGLQDIYSHDTCVHGEMVIHTKVLATLADWGSELKLPQHGSPDAQNEGSGSPLPGPSSHLHRHSGTPDSQQRRSETPSSPPINYAAVLQMLNRLITCETAHTCGTLPAQHTLQCNDVTVAPWMSVCQYLIACSWLGHHMDWIKP
eukprot:1162075-Pelagomonas_calceolata.AAC.20